MMPRDVAKSTAESTGVTDCGPRQTSREIGCREANPPVADISSAQMPSVVNA